MLIRLEREQVSAAWDDIKDTLIQALPPTAMPDEDAMLSVLQMILEDKMQAWVIVDKTASLNAVIITSIVEDIGTMQKNLLIYSLYGYRFISVDLWQDGLNTMRRFAASMGCKAILGYTEVPRIIDVVKQLGGSAKTTLVRLEV